MLNVTKELTALARKLGYTGTAPDTVAKAINAITASVGEGGGSGCDCKTMVVHAALDDEQYLYITDITAGELFALLEDEYIVFVSFPTEEEDEVYISMITEAYSNNKGISFGCADTSPFTSSPNEHPRSPLPITDN